VTDSERNVILSRCVAPPTGRVRKLGPRYYVTDLENPGELLHGPEFTKKGDAVRYAERNAQAVWDRLKKGATE
jgi:hypothetical protein